MTKYLTDLEITKNIKEIVLTDITVWRRNIAPLVRECCCCHQIKACPSSYLGQYICYSCSLKAAEMDSYAQIKEIDTSPLKNFERAKACQHCGSTHVFTCIGDVYLCRSCAFILIEKKLNIKF